jgi:hypothetical protein
VIYVMSCWSGASLCGVGDGDFLVGSIYRSTAGGFINGGVARFSGDLRGTVSFSAADQFAVGPESESLFGWACTATPGGFAIGAPAVSLVAVF